MTTRSRTLVASGAALLGAAALHAGPALTFIAPMRRRLLPKLSGLGRQTVALTFDDGPDPESTPKFLDLLAELRVPATFFVLGEMAERAPDLLLRLRDEGHEIGVHGWRHRNHLRLTPARVYDELRRTSELIEQVCGVRPAWFRPPYGVLTGGGCAAAARLHLRPLLWSAWGVDWEAAATPQSVLEHLRRGGLRPGATLLLHDSDCTSAPGAWRSALGALPTVVEECRAQNASFVTVSEHMR